MMRPVPRFFANSKDIFQFHHGLKLLNCPHCRKSGFLIRHGFLKGYNIFEPNQQIIRGHRFFCSNRNRRAGCGRTFSILAAKLLKQFTINTQSLWALLGHILNDQAPSRVIHKLPFRFSVSSAYRLFHLFCRAQSTIRSVLTRRLKLLTPCHGPSPPHQTIAHLKAGFPRCQDPIRSFQITFQQSFL